MFDISAKLVSGPDEIYGVKTIGWEDYSWKYLSLIGDEQVINTLQLSEEVKSLLFRLGETPENFTGRILFMSMFNDISCGTRDNEQECFANARLVSLSARKFGKGQWSFVGPGSEKKWSSISEDSPQGEWDNMAERMILEFAESGHPIFRAMSALSRGRLKSKGHGKLSIHYCADWETIKTVFAQLLL